MAERGREPDPMSLSRAELAAYLRDHHVVSLWPFAGRALNLSRSSTYGCRDIPTLRLGHLLKVRSAWLEATLFGNESGSSIVVPALKEVLQCLRLDLPDGEAL